MLFTFPSRYSFAIGLSVVFSLPGWSPGIQTGFLVSRPTQVPLLHLSLTVRGLHPLRPDVPDGSARFRISLSRLLLPRHVPKDTAGLGSSPFARRYWGNRCYFLFLQVLRCFSSLRSPQHHADDGIAPAGLPHSDIRGSLRICRSPRLFAACHVLLRLREPRHPPCALSLFRFSFFFCSLRPV